MPSNLPSSFASAAAGQNASRDARGGRGDGRGGGGDWARRDGRANGTLTFRRSSTTPGQASQPTPSADPFAQTSTDSAVQNPGISNYDFAPQVSQYSKDTILGLFQNGIQLDTPDVLEASWTPGNVNGNSSRGWGKSSHPHANQDPNSCWVSDASNSPNGIRAFSAEEKEVFSTDVNSPVKPPNQKEGAQQPGTNGRKTSVSHGSGPGFGLTSPTSATRPRTQRRETTDANPFGSSGLSSPAGTGRFNRDDGGFILGRKGPDTKEPDLSEEEGGASSRDAGQGRGGFGGLVRSNTSGTPGVQGSNISSLWGQANSPQQPTSASGIGSFGQFALPTAAAAVGGPARGGSRFANLIPKDNEGGAAKPGEAGTPDLNRSWRTRPRTDTDPFGDDGPSGSAALGGAQDSSPPPMPTPGGANNGPFETPVKGSTGDFGMSGLNLGQQGDNDQGPISPSETNPYRSPPADRNEAHDDSSDRQQGAGFGADQASNFGTIPRGFPTGHAFDGSDRSQTSSAGPKAYPSLSMTGWPAPLPTGTPDRDRQGFAGAFGNSLFSPAGEMQSPGLGNIGSGVFGPPSAGGIGATGSIGRSKLGSLFPAAMQAQMQGHEQPENLSDSLPDLRQANPLGAIGRNNFAPPRDTGSPMRSGRGMFEELFPSSAESRAQNAFGSVGVDPGLLGTPGAGTPQGFAQGGGAPVTDLPTSQVRQMVMPDRMRWVYLDPQGQVQGPFTGLEMNDWYKANFFTADLRVKKVEDGDFEPLGQLIRRIGNSREPFLVPQIGVPHGPPSAAGPFSPTTTGGIVPPLSGLFPSFGRTLTAEEQNNLERRKQEEQFAMAQQREHIIRQQAISRLHPGTGQSSLHHHSSAQSLQSQPSFGSIASPIGGAQQTPTAGAPGSSFFDGASAQQGSGQAPIGASYDSFRDDDMANLNATERQILAAGLQGSGGSFFPPQPIGAPTDAQLRANLPGTDQLAEDEEGFRERLEEFEGLRAELDAEQQQQQQQQRGETAHQSIEQDVAELIGGEDYDTLDDEIQQLQQLSLTQQVQKAQAAAAAHSEVTGLPTSFPPPPPQSGTPLPAPTAQRARSNLPEQYSRSQSGTPDTSSAVEPPPPAPWAVKKEIGPSSHKGPSLKEIQEAEARNAAKAEEAAAAARRAAHEQEAAALREREKAAAAAIATGLPTTSTWGNGSPVGAASPWTKPGVAKASAVVAGPSKHKTLADIQREEEARKGKAAALAAQAGAVAAAGKRYADLATRPGHALGPQPQQAGTVAPPPGAGWATVGAGGRVKAPTGPATGTQSPVRSASTSNAKIAPSVRPAAVKPAAPAPASNAKSEAMDEFKKWLDREVARGITGVDVDTFTAILLTFPLDTTIIADAIYSNSKTMHGTHFAEEFIRRKKRADQGIVEKQPGSNDAKVDASASGWNEVAKKGGHKEPAPADNAIQGASFKVVPGRKKGSKK